MATPQRITQRVPTLDDKVNAMKQAFPYATLPTDFGSHPNDQITLDMFAQNRATQGRQEQQMRRENEAYKPNFLDSGLGALFGGQYRTISAISPNSRLESVMVWSDVQNKEVPAFEYLRETEPHEVDVVEAATEGTKEVVGKKVSQKYGESAVRREVIKHTVAKVPVAGKLLGKAVGNLAGIDVITMGDATIEGHQRREREGVRAEYDDLAIAFKRDAVKAAVAGKDYQPEFLKPLEQIRQITDYVQDFMPRKEDSSFLSRLSMDRSERAEGLRTGAFKNESDYIKENGKGMGKAAINYEKKPVDVA